MKRLVHVVIFLLLSSAHSAYASVVLNEIAWMGTSNSASDEWIELHNLGSTTIDMVGWKIAGKGGAIIAALSGSISPDGYFLIERSNDDTVPNVHADLVTAFGKGLSNDGETLKLIDGIGTVIDTVVGGKKWTKVGGDNVSKMTAQRTLYGWITATPTPRSPNASPTKGERMISPITPTPPVISTSKRSTANKSGIQERMTPHPPPIVSTSTMIQPSATNSGANVLWTREGGAPIDRHWWIWAGFLLIVATMILATLMGKQTVRENEADAYTIIEHTSDQDIEEE